MKSPKQTLTILLAALLVSSALTATACSKDKTPSVENQPGTTDTVMDTMSNPDTDGSAQTDAITDESADATTTTESETTDENAISSSEAVSLLTAAMEADQAITDGTATIRYLINGEALSLQTYSQNGSNFRLISTSMGMTTALTVVDSMAYYVISYDDGEFTTEEAYRIPLTDAEKQELYALTVSQGSLTGSDQSLYSGLLASEWSGTRLPDGSIALTSSKLSEELNSLLKDDSTAGSDLFFDITLSPDGTITFLRFTWQLPAELAGGEELEVSSEMSTDYTAPTILAPASDEAYVDATYDQIFGITLPEIDPEVAALVGLPLDEDIYVIGGDSPYDIFAQYEFFCANADCYMDKTFILYGSIRTDEWGDCYLSVGDEMEFWMIFPDTLPLPDHGDYVKLTATYSGYMGYGMVVSAVEQLEPPAQTAVTMYVTAYTLNVRSSPDSSAGADNILGQFVMGQAVSVLETGLGANGTWCKIRYNGSDGYAYVSMNYLSESKPHS